jgi:osmotically-inducible protein OsmY
MKTSICHLKLFAFALAMLLVAGHAARSMTQSDEWIKLTIEKEIANSPELGGVQVHVLVEDGNVVLLGAVRFYIQKMQIEKIAWQTEGVVEVDNEAHVVPQAPLSDVAIKGKILEIIRDHDRFHDAQIKVKVKEGSVSLDGTFHYPRDVIFLKHRVAEIEGVISVQFEIAFRV